MNMQTKILDCNDTICWFLMQASMIWIIGEYAERIDNADELLESFLETFPEEPAQVQLQLLTAAVKLFLKKPTEGPQQMIQVSSISSDTGCRLGLLLMHCLQLL
jgi:vesicle coat complex subunit